MGLFDYIRCEYPLPDGFEGDLRYQTKDTPAYYMEDYTITRDGKLVHHAVRYETVPKAERPYPDASDDDISSFLGSVRSVPTGDVEIDFHGALEFYTTNICGLGPHGCMTEDDEPPWHREYVALFDHGSLIKIEGGLTWSDSPHLPRAEWHRRHTR